jgi:cbb3-type cytochrome oxidase subunit 3
MVKSRKTSLVRPAVFGAITFAADIIPPSLALAAPSSGEEASGGVLMFIIIIGGAFFLLRAVIRKRRQNAARRVADEALQIAKSEIDSKAAALRIKRIQTVQADHYGTVSLDKWEKEKTYFIDTRIMPLLRPGVQLESKLLGRDFDSQDLAVKIWNMIEEAALRPAPS